MLPNMRVSVDLRQVVSRVRAKTRAGVNCAAPDTSGNAVSR
jgi:hypothetical protein